MGVSLKVIFNDQGGRGEGVSQKVIFGDKGGGGSPGPPKNHDIIIEQPLRGKSNLDLLLLKGFCNICLVSIIKHLQ